MLSLNSSTEVARAWVVQQFLPNASLVMQLMIEIKHLIKFDQSPYQQHLHSLCVPSFFLETCMYTMNDPFMLHFTTLFDFIIMSSPTLFTNILLSLPSAYLQEEIPSLWFCFFFAIVMILV